MIVINYVNILTHKSLLFKKKQNSEMVIYYVTLNTNILLLRISVDRGWRRCNTGSAIWLVAGIDVRT